MRILFLASTFPRYAGDMQANFVGEQAAAWKAARPEDEIIILAPHDPSAATREDWNGIEVIRFRYMRPARWQGLAYPAILPNLKRRPWLAIQVPSFILAEYLSARKLVSGRGIDLVYAHWVMPQGLVALWLNQRCGTPFVVHNHSSDLRVFERFGKPGAKLARSIIRAARHLFCVNSGQREYALDLFDKTERGSISDKTSVLPMGVNPPASSRSGKPHYLFGSISRLSKKKGLHHFIAAAEVLAAKGDRGAIGIAGDGEDAAELKAMVGRAETEFPGFLSGQEKDHFFDDTQVFVMSSVASGGDVEGMPVSLLEALCRGKPTVASRDTNITCLPEWPQIRDEVFYLENPADTAAFADVLKRAAASTKEKSDGNERLRSIMSRYWWQNLIREYLTALNLKG